jgi:hypothetical protein
VRDEHNPRQCKGDYGTFCPLTDEEETLKRKADDMLKKYGSDPNVCVTLWLVVGAPTVCRRIPDDVGPHQIAWCHMVGPITCWNAGRVRDDANDTYGGGPPKGAADDSEEMALWNAHHHGYWMASLVLSGVSPEDALMLGVAHELDGTHVNGAPAYGSVDSRIDMNNNRIGIAIGQQALRSRSPHQVSPSMRELIDRAGRPGCAPCLDVTRRPA